MAKDITDYDDEFEAQAEVMIRSISAKARALHKAEQRILDLEEQLHAATTSIEGNLLTIKLVQEQLLQERDATIKATQRAYTLEGIIQGSQHAMLAAVKDAALNGAGTNHAAEASKELQAPSRG